MPEEKSFWGEVPNNAEPRTKSDLSGGKFDKRWFLAIAAVIVLLVVGIISHHLDNHRPERFMIEHLVLLERGSRLVRKDVHVVVLSYCRH